MSASPSPAMRARKPQQGKPNASHEQMLDASLTEEQRRSAMKNGTYYGDDADGKLKPRRPRSAASNSLLSSDSIVILVLTLLAGLVRFWKIWHPDQVVFDEVHFGKFASYYLRREYYFDVHPPFAKMLNAFAGYLAGFPGNFDFENIGDKYIPANVPYVKLRSLPAIMGTIQTPLMYMIMRETGHAKIVGLFSAALLLFDNAHITQDRLILLDAALCLFMILSLYSYIKFYKQRYNEFSFAWWAWMIATGVNLSLTMSCKMVGLLTFFTVGSAVAVDLWNLLDVKRGLTIQQLAKHFFARVLGLIVIPAFVYLFWFWVHFKILIRSGPGDSFMSSEFQQTLQGNSMLAQARSIHYGDSITLRHKSTNAFLHSHLDRYPMTYEDGRISSQGQQVTGYPFNDTNNVWQIVPTIALPEEAGEEYTVRNGHQIRLLHVNTQSYLLTHDVASPLTTTNEEFTTLPINDTTRYNDTLFELVISGKSADAPWRSKASWFKLIHVPTKVAMWTQSETPLPEWAYKQQEINGNKNVGDKTTLWYVDDVTPDPLAADAEERSKPIAPRKAARMPFLKKFAELQLQMLQQNAGLTQSHPYASGPINWPFLLNGISFWTSNDEQEQVYLMGNIVSWWLSILLVAVYIGIMGADALARRRGLEPIAPNVRRRMGNSVGFFVAAWAFHYLPFFLMNRQLFLHHYLPAHMCACLAAGGIFQFIAVEEVEGPVSHAGPLLGNSSTPSAAPADSTNTIKTPLDVNVPPRRLSPREAKTHVILPPAALAVLGVVCVLLFAFFVFLSPLTYGTPGLTSPQVAKRKLLSSWTLHFMPSTSEQP